MSWNTAPVMNHSGNHSCLVACAIIALFIANVGQHDHGRHARALHLGDDDRRLLLRSASSPNVVPLLVYGLSVVSVPPYFVK